MMRAALLVVLISAVALPAFAQPAAVARGSRLADAMCKQCHAVGKQGDSPNPAAPRFRDLTMERPGRSLEEIFAGGLLVLHPGMPSWAMTDRDQSDLLAYLRTLQRTAAS
jgi:mono/diheme cytochrome c family protein